MKNVWRRMRLGGDPIPSDNLVLADDAEIRARSNWLIPGVMTLICHPINEPLRKICSLVGLDEGKLMRSLAVVAYYDCMPLPKDNEYKTAKGYIQRVTNRTKNNRRPNSRLEELQLEGGDRQKQLRQDVSKFPPVSGEPALDQCQYCQKYFHYFRGRGISIIAHCGSDHCSREYDRVRKQKQRGTKTGWLSSLKRRNCKRCGNRRLVSIDDICKKCW
jgi:hypothetical protein